MRGGTLLGQADAAAPHMIHLASSPSSSPPSLSNTLPVRKLRLRKRISDAAKKVAVCPWCAALNGQVKKVAGAQTLKVIHDRWKGAWEGMRRRSRLSTTAGRVRVSLGRQWPQRTPHGCSHLRFGCLLRCVLATSSSLLLATRPFPTPPLPAPCSPVRGGGGAPRL